LCSDRAPSSAVPKQSLGKGIHATEKFPRCKNLKRGIEACAYTGKGGPFIENKKKKIQRGCQGHNMGETGCQTINFVAPLEAGKGSPEVN